MSRSTPPRDALGRYIISSYLLADLNHDQQSLYIHCDDYKCTHGQRFTIPDLLDLLGPAATSQDVMWTIRCPRCGRLPGGIKLITN